MLTTPKHDVANDSNELEKVEQEMVAWAKGEYAKAHRFATSIGKENDPAIVSLAGEFTGAGRRMES